MRCTGPQPTISLAKPHMVAHKSNFTGVTLSSSCNAAQVGFSAKPSFCLVTICAGRLVLRGSSVAGVRGIPVESVVCVVGDSRLEVHSSKFGWNQARPLAVYNKAHLLLNASIVSSNSAEGSGAGLLVEGNASVAITGRSRVHGNNAGADGGGIYAGRGAWLTIDDSFVTGNVAVFSGGGLNVYGARVVLNVKSSVHSNVARSGGGGGLHVNKGNVTFTGGSRVFNNTSGRFGGGLYIEGETVMTLTGGSSVFNNTSTGQGGGLYVFGGVPIVEDYEVIISLSEGSSVHSNTAGKSGGGLEVARNASVTLTGASSVYGNTAADQGGGLYVFDARVTLSGGSSVHSNTARLSGGGLAVVGMDGMFKLTDGSSVHRNRALNGTGGGLAAYSGARVTISNQSTISNNKCFGAVGGGMAVDIEDATFDARGRIVAADTNFVADVASNVSVSGSKVSNNTSIRSAGGGMAVGGNANIELVHGTVLSNNLAVNSSGGGVMLVGNGTFRADASVVFVNNLVTKGYVGDAIATFENSTLHLPHGGGGFSRCSAGVYLGGSICQAGETQQFDRCMCCPQHTFSFTNASCEPCPRNGNCSAGSLVQPLPGYWSSAPTSIQMHRCPLSTTACNYTAPTRQCNEGYKGPLCGACQLPQYGMLSPFRCGKCMLPRVQLGVYLLLSFMVVVFIVFTVHSTWRDNQTGNKGVVPTDYIKVLVSFLQYTVVIGSVSVAWPLFDVQRWFQAVNIVYAVGSGQALSLDCWLYHYIPSTKLPLAMQRQLVSFVAAVVVLLAVLLLQWLTWALVQWVVPIVWRRKQGATQHPDLLVGRKLPVTLLVVAFYAFPTLSQASLSFFACLRIDQVPPEVQLPPGASAPLNHTAGYWVSDITQQCFAGYHKGWALGLGVPSVLLWCIAVHVATTS